MSLELQAEDAHSYVHSVNYHRDQERHQAQRIAQQALSMSNLAEVSKQRRTQHKSSDEARTAHTRERRGPHETSLSAHFIACPISLRQRLHLHSRHRPDPMDILNGSAQQFGDTPCLRDATAWLVRRIAAADFGNMT
jgi:hypothetical protein